MQQRSVFVPKPCLEKVAKPDEPQLHISSDAPCLPKASFKKKYSFLISQNYTNMYPCFWQNSTFDILIQN